jgi:16S rRNA C967 or C1407 C5-methylase (RsmB/RsmF family)
MQGLGTADDIRTAVERRYSQVSREPNASYNFRVGRAFAEALGYPSDLLGMLPASVTDAFTGVSNPSLIAEVTPGETVVDFGSCGGLNLAILARKVGATSRPVAIDLAADTVDMARRNVARMGLAQAEVATADSCWPKRRRGLRSRTAQSRPSMIGSVESEALCRRRS